MPLILGTLVLIGLLWLAAKSPITGHLAKLVLYLIIVPGMFWAALFVAVALEFPRGNDVKGIFAIIIGAAASALPVAITFPELKKAIRVADWDLRLWRDE